MNNQSPIVEGHKTIDAMVRIYCHDHHETTADLCAACAELLVYAHERLDKCPSGEDKPNCSDCTVHCYRPDMRERISAVMRYAGPRMLFRHPVMALRHLARGFRNKSS